MLAFDSTSRHQLSNHWNRNKFADRTDSTKDIVGLSHVIGLEEHFEFFGRVTISTITSRAHDMPPFRPLSLRDILGRSPFQLRLQQRRWARVHDVRFVATHGSQDRIMDRYKDKLDRRAKEYVVTDLTMTLKLSDLILMRSFSGMA